MVAWCLASSEDPRCYMKCNVLVIARLRGKPLKMGCVPSLYVRLSPAKAYAVTDGSAVNEFKSCINSLCYRILLAKLVSDLR